MADYALFQPSTGGYVCSFSMGSNGGSILGFTEVKKMAVFGSKKSMSSLLDSIDFDRPAIADTLMIVRFNHDE